MENTRSSVSPESGKGRDGRITASKSSAPTNPAPGTLNSLRLDFFRTAIVQVSVAGATFAQYGLIRRWYGVEALGDFSQLMRVRGILEFAVLLLLPMAVTRELAMLPQNVDSRMRRLIIDTGSGMGLLFVLICILTLLNLPKWSAIALFGNASFVSWITPFCFLLGGYAMCLMVAATARGLQIFSAVNLLQFLYVAAIPIVFLIFCRSRPITTAVIAMGLAATMVAIIFFIRLRLSQRGPTQAATPLRDYIGASAKLLKYGVPRLLVIACMGLQGLILPWLVSWRGDRAFLAALNSFAGVVSVSTLLVSPLGMIMLPHLSRLIASGKRDEAGRQTSRILTFAILIGGFGSMGALALLRPMITIWLGADFAQYSILLAAAGLVMPGFVILEVMRSPLDSISAIPWNALTYFTGAAVTALVFFAANGSGRCTIESSIAMSWVAGVGAAVSMSVWIGRILLRFRIAEPILKICGCWWVAAAAFQATGYFWLPVIWHVATGLILTSGYFVLLLRTAPAWLIDLAPRGLQPFLMRFSK